MIVAQISDTHICLPEPENSQRLLDLERAVEEINQLKTRPDVVVHTGDITHWGTIEEYEAAHELLINLKVPLYAIPGNRDKRAAMGTVFGDAIGACEDPQFFQYVLDQWSTRLIMLDTLNENDRLGEFCANRMNSLASMLDADRDKSTVIFMHHPPFDVVQAPEPFQFDSRKTIEQLRGILDENPQVAGIFCGHSHRMVHAQLGEIQAATIPAIAMDLRFGEFPQSHDDRPVFLVHEF